MEYADIAGVVECGKRKANLYLEHGYKLLGIIGTSYARPFPEGARGTASHFVARDFRYILGRPDGVDVYEPPEWTPIPAPKEAGR